MTYASQGGIASAGLGNGVTETRTYNVRLQPTQIAVGGKVTLKYRYGTTENNGNILRQEIVVNGSHLVNQAYSYDGFNRLSVAGEYTGTPPSSLTCPDSGSVWCRKYEYDTWGNMAMTQATGQGQPTVLSFSSSTNRITTSGFSYDTAGAGNVTKTAASSATYGYDAENRQVAYCVSDSNPANCVQTAASGRTLYFYDGEGRRVKVQKPDGSYTVFV